MPYGLSNPAMDVQRFMHTVTILLGYGVLFFVFDTQARFFEVAPGVRPWHPVAGINLSLLVLFGVAYAPAVFVATFVSGLLHEHAHLSIVHLAVKGLIITAGYGLAAHWLRKKLKRHSLFTPYFLKPFLATALLLPAALGVLIVPGLILAHVPGYTWSTLTGMLFHWWGGDAVGILTLTPFIITTLGPYINDEIRAAAVGEGLPLRLDAQDALSFTAELAAITLAAYFAIFFPANDDYQLYICLLPLLWIAFRHGLPRATLGIFLLNVSTVVLLRVQGETILHWKFLSFMITLAVIGLVVGALISERKRALASLKQACSRLESEVVERNEALQQADLERRQAEQTLQKYVEELERSRDQIAAHLQTLARLNDKLSESEKQLRDLNARKDKLFSIISHDVRNMLVSSIGFSNLLVSDSDVLPREMIKEFASHVHSATSNTYDLLENLLTWARLQTGRLPCQRALHDVHDLVRNNALMFQSNAAQKNITLETKIDLDSDARIYVDRNMINSVLQNLISNAIKFTKTGGQVTVGARSYDHCVEFTVSDTGVGMNQDEIEKLFRIDVPHKSTGTNDEAGTGLGLTLCKEMIERHDGRIDVESQAGRGSTFRITLPYTEPESEQPEQPDESHRSQ